MGSSAYTGALRIFGVARKGAPTRQGMILAFKPTASRVLGNIPARVIAIGPRFRSGEYLVTLEYPRPIQYHKEVIVRIDAFRSELYQPDTAPSAIRDASHRPAEAAHWPA